MALIIRKKEGRDAWYIRGTVAGRRIEESTGTTSKSLAEQYKAKREAELHTENLYGKAAVATFSDAVVSYIKAGGSKRYLDTAIVHFAGKPLGKIGQDDIEEYAAKLYPNAKPSTITRQAYAPVSAVMHHAAAKGWCGIPKIIRPSQPAGRVRWLKKDEAERLIEACSPHMARLVTFLFYTGARCGEALWLDWDNVDMERRTVMFIDTKNNTSRGVPMHSKVHAALIAIDGRTGYVFRTQHGEPYRANTETDYSAGSRIKTAFKAACKRAGINDFHPHDCRHTWATWHYIANRDLGALMRLGGWKTMSMVMRYAHVNVDELASTIERI